MTDTLPATPTITAQEKRRFRQIGHHLKPVVSFGGKGVTEGLLAELDRALNDHELIKVKIHAENRDDRTLIIQELCRSSGALLIQSIGNIALVYRPADKPNPKLSNILRAAAQ